MPEIPLYPSWACYTNSESVPGYICFILFLQAANPCTWPASVVCPTANSTCFFIIGGARNLGITCFDINQHQWVRPSIKSDSMSETESYLTTERQQRMSFHADFSKGGAILRQLFKIFPRTRLFFLGVGIQNANMGTCIALTLSLEQYLLSNPVSSHNPRFRLSI